MRFDIITLFPEMFSSVFAESIGKRAIDEGHIELYFWNPRDFSKDKHKKVDDIVYGGGKGMLMQCQPLFDVIEKVKEHNTGPVVYMSAAGEFWDQQKAVSMSEDHRNVVLLCGRYEGIDQRVIDTYVDHEVCIGSYVLTGGELPAMLLIDSVMRLLPGVIQGDSHQYDSFSAAFNGKQEYPHYTRPEKFRDLAVPQILLSGNHAKIEAWRKEHLR
jgi:tRNA (guanine37-N1)-methyltransferase